MSKYFIDRPIFASVLSIIIVLAGLVCMKILPIAQYPEIAPPTVTITAVYPGASAETLSKTVAGPIEEQLSGVDNLLYFSSVAASNGTVTITATFEVGTDIDKATFNVNNRVGLATARLPSEVIRNGVTVAKGANDILLFVSLVSKGEKFDTLYMSNYASLHILDELKRLKGTANVSVFGARDYGMRIWLQPDKMAQLGITTTDIEAAINAQNAQFAAGKIGAEPSSSEQQVVYTVTARGRLVDPEQFGDIVVRSTAGGGVLRLKDVARVELGAQSYDQFITLNGVQTVGVAVFLQSGANAIDLSKAIHAKMEELKQDFPDGLEYFIPYDTTRFVQASITEVTHTMIEAAILVILVIFLFLQTWRAALIPIIAVPVSLIGTFAGLWLFDFSINTLTLFAMVLAIGIVVDDAIVVLENVERLMRDRKMSPYAAAVEAMREVQGAVIGIVLVLCAVFIPVAFLGGIAGQLYRQFAVTVSVSVVLSGVVALTLTPALCAILLKADEHDHPGFLATKIFIPFNRFFEKLTNRFVSDTGKMMARRTLTLAAFGVLLIVLGLLFWRVPGSFVPEEDQGYSITAVVLPDGASIHRTRKTAEMLSKMVEKNPAMENIFVVNGFDLIGGGNKSSAATLFLVTKPWEDRNISTKKIVEQMTGMGFGLPDGIAFSFLPPSIAGLGNSGGFEVYVEARTDTDPLKLSAVVQDFVAALGKDPALAGVNTFFRPTVPQIRVDVDREKALALGVSEADVFTALQAQMGSLYVNDFNKFGRTYRVQIQADAPFRSKPEDLGAIYVRSNTTGSMIPLKSLITVNNIVGPEQLDRYNGYVSAKVIGSAKPGYSSGEALKALEKVAKATLPQGYSIELTGQAFQEKRTGSASVFAFGFAIVMVFLILAALYERWGLPLAVLLAVPFAITGALGFVWLRGMDNNIYFQIGLIVLIGLAAKNAILIVEFAQQGLQEGMTAVDAAMNAVRLRFRPIIMTSVAFVLGMVPLVIATGAGAAARQSMGSGVFGGMIIATFIAPAFVPLFFVLLARKPKTNPEAPVEEEKTV